MPKRSYGQYCGVARALDDVGERWSLLIVRELLVSPARYGELLSGLPGIATNLLTNRLREMEKAGIVERTLDSKRNGVAYKLTARGNGLREVIAALTKWGTPLMISGPEKDTFQAHWLVVALDSLLCDRRTDKPTVVGLAVDDAIITLEVDRTGTRVLLGNRNDLPNTVLHSDAAAVWGMASGTLTVEQAVAAGDLYGRMADLAVAFNPAEPSERQRATG